MPYTLSDFTALLQHLQTPVVVLTPSTTLKSGWEITQHNMALEALMDRENIPSNLADMLVADNKQPHALLENKPLKAETPIVVTPAFLSAPDGKQVRVKLKHDWLTINTPEKPETILLVWIEPLSEDVALSQAHADFVSVVSHEFRTPLTSIKGFADTMLRYGNSLDAEQQKRFIGIIKHQADRLTRLVENLLTVSKMGAQRSQIDFRPVALKKMVDRIVQTIEAKSPDPRTFQVDIAETLPEVWGDPDKLEQILTNLIDNAVKYSFANTKVSITALLDSNNAENKKNETMTIKISDEGVGIPKDHLAKIFSKFSRIDNPLTREVEGTGLGLFITKSLTVAMNGDIHVESEDGKGTTFVVTLPVATAEIQMAARSAQTTESHDESVE